MTNKIRIGIISILGVVVLTGCGTKQLRMTYDSNPQGASLICNGKNWGYTPEEHKEKGFINLSPCSVKWISGATAGGTMIKADLNKIGYSQIITYQRPNVDRYEKDAQFALQVQNMKYQRRQAQAAESAASSARTQNHQLQRVNSYIRYGY